MLWVNLLVDSFASLALAISLQSNVLFHHSSSMKMLWVNLIMDSFASLALATEDPTLALLDRLDPLIATDRNE